MGVYVVRMDQQQRDRLPSIFADLGYPEPFQEHREGAVRYSFRFGLLSRLSVDVFEVERPSGVTYDLWIPPTRLGGELFEALRDRGYSRVRGEKDDTKPAGS
jgi:hypothetical protein